MQGGASLQCGYCNTTHVLDKDDVGLAIGRAEEKLARPQEDEAEDTKPVAS